MQLIKFSVVLVLLTARVLQAKIVLETSRPNKTTFDLVEAVVNIVTSCYGDRIETIGLAGNLPDSLITTLSKRYFIPVALIGNTYKFGDWRESIDIRFQHKLDAFIVEASSFHQFDSLLTVNVQFSMWWNNKASFIILDLSPNCADRNDYLYLAWQNDILNAKVICFYRKNGITVFGFNPYTSQAPISWQPHWSFLQKNRHPFTVFSRRYGGNKSICVDLDFEKTKNLGNYPIKVKGILPNNEFEMSKLHHGAYAFWSKVSRPLNGLRDVLNVTLKFGPYETSKGRTFYDIRQRTTWINYGWKTHLITYPHDSFGVVIISQFRGHKSQLNKILSVIDRTSRFGMIIAYLITLMFFKFFVRQAVVPALLNVVRITCNTGFTNLPGNTASRIYLGSLLFFVVTMQGIYQGNLASLLTTVIPLPNIDTVQELVDSGYKIFVATDVINMIDHPSIRQIDVKKLKNNIACLTEVRNDPSAVCIHMAQGGTLDMARQFDLHISKVIVSIYQSYDIRWDWDLEERVNAIIQRFVEADMLEPWDLKCNPIKLSDFEFDETVKKNQVFKNIELGELAFAFTILGVGLTCSIFTFIIELAIQYECKCRCKVFVRRRLGRKINANTIHVIPSNLRNRIP